MNDGKEKLWLCCWRTTIFDKMTCETQIANRWESLFQIIKPGIWFLTRRFVTRYINGGCTDLPFLWTLNFKAVLLCEGSLCLPKRELLFEWAYIRRNLSICFTVAAQLFLRPSKKNNGNGNNWHNLKLHSWIFDSTGSSVLGLSCMRTRSVWVWFKVKCCEIHCTVNFCCLIIIICSLQMWEICPPDLSPCSDSLWQFFPNFIRHLRCNLHQWPGDLVLRLSMSVAPVQRPSCPSSHTKHPEIILYSISVLVFQLCTYLVLGGCVF
jgi:hypothetical protein